MYFAVIYALVKSNPFKLFDVKAKYVPNSPGSLDKL